MHALILGSVVVASLASGTGQVPPPPWGGSQPRASLVDDHTTQEVPPIQEAFIGFAPAGPDGVFTFYFDSDDDPATDETSNTDDPIDAGLTLVWLLTGTGDPPTTYAARMRACYEEAKASCKNGVKKWEYSENTSSTGTTTSSCRVECN